jgi:integrase
MPRGSASASAESRRSRRAIDLAPTLKAALARLPSRFKREMVFTAADGGVIDPDNFVNRDWARTLRRSALRRIRFHDLRHTYASLLIAQGAHPKYIQAQLGHASIQTTLDRYGHLMPEIHQIGWRSEVSPASLTRPAHPRRRHRKSDAAQRMQNGCRQRKEASEIDR